LFFFGGDFKSIVTTCLALWNTNPHQLHKEVSKTNVTKTTGQFPPCKITELLGLRLNWPQKDICLVLVDKRAQVAFLKKG